jgi:hypothetical protein
MLMDPTGETGVKVTLTLPEGYTVAVPADVKRTMRNKRASCR